MTNKTAFLITTYNRSASCKRLVEQLEHLGDIYIIDDGSTEDYTWAHRFNYQRKPYNGGKSQYWHTVTLLWQMVHPHRDEYKYFIMLPDDFTPEPNFLSKSIQTWEAITDPSKICLNLYVDRGRLNTPNWTGVMPVIHPEARKIQWVDMCFLAEVQFFRFLEWGVSPLEFDWKSKPELGSGVGSNISRKLHYHGFSLWQTHTSMFRPAAESYSSKMNSQRPASHGQIHDIVPGTITAQIASIPARRHMLRQTVESLRPQVDRIFVSLNGYPDTPDFLQPGEYIHLDNSTGDAAKFYNVENISGYLLTCDDDLVYPPGYVQYMISNLHKYNAITTLHGKIYPRPVTRFVDFTTNVRCLFNWSEDIQVDVPGTGVTCLHTDMIDIRYSDFKIRNMADIWLAQLAHLQNVKIMALAHPADYLTYLQPAETIYTEEKQKGFEIQTQILQETFNTKLCKKHYTTTEPKQRF